VSGLEEAGGGREALVKIHRDRLGGLSPGLEQLGQERVKEVSSARGDRQRGPVGSESKGRGAADAAAGATDEGVFTP
jgi:hypothetical protein